MTQISVVLAARDNLRQTKTLLEREISQQSQEQNDVYQYLRKKLKDNYVAIAALEAKVRDEQLLLCDLDSHLFPCEAIGLVFLLALRCGLPSLAY